MLNHPTWFNRAAIPGWRDFSVSLIVQDTSPSSPSTRHLYKYISIYFSIVRSMDLLILDVQVESEKSDLKKHTKICLIFSLCSMLSTSPQHTNDCVLNVNGDFYLSLAEVLYYIVHLQSWSKSFISSSLRSFFFAA